MRLFLLLLLIIPTKSLAADVTAGCKRTSGVAPFVAECWADLHDSVTAASLSDYHTLHYECSFDDPTSGTWHTGSAKNTDNGPVCAHVYESPGTYNFTITAINPTTGTEVTGSSESFTITVSDPDTVYSGNTTCISDTTNNNFTGCPDGATEVSTDNINDLSAYTGANHRVLFHRGSNWTVTQTITVSSGDTQHFGAYGTCSNPNAQGICENAPEINATTDIYVFGFNQTRDHRIVDIEFNNPTQVGSVTSGTIDFKNVLWMRLSGSGWNVALGTGNWRADAADKNEGLYVIDNNFSGMETNGTYTGAENLVYIGNIIKDIDDSHVARIYQAYISVISHNELSGSSLVSGTGRTAIKLHSVEEPILGTFAETSNAGMENRTQFVVMEDNIFGSCGPWPVAIEPQNGGKDERISDLLFVNNRALAGYGNQSASLVQLQVSIGARYVTARNNILDGTGGDVSYTGFYIVQRGIEPAPHDIYLYNNTIYTNTNHSTRIRCINAESNVVELIVRNNLCSSALTTGTKTFIYDETGGGVVTESNNLFTDTPYLLDPNNANPLLRDYSLTSSSTAAIDTGYAVPVYDDFSGNLRDANIDIGAFEYGTATCSTTPSLCSDQSECETAGWNWCTDTCQSAACGSSGITLPWSTTYNCADWLQYSDDLNCDGISKKGSWTTTPSGNYEQIISAANNPDGDGGKGQRHWIGEGTNNNSGSVQIDFATPPSNVFIRWYQRWESGFPRGWDSFKNVWFEPDTGSRIVFRQTASTSGNEDITLVAIGGTPTTTTIANRGWGVDYYTGGTSDGTWVCFEVNINLTSNIWQVWIDGTQVVNETGIDYGGASTVSHIILPENVKNHPTGAGEMYVDFDDVAIATSYIGPLDQPAPADGNVLQVNGTGMVNQINGTGSVLQ